MNKIPANESITQKVTKVNSLLDFEDTYLQMFYSFLSHKDRVDSREVCKILKDTVYTATRNEPLDIKVILGEVYKFIFVPNLGLWRIEELEGNAKLSRIDLSSFGVNIGISCIAQIAVGDDSFAIVTKSGNVYMCGNNKHGKLGIGRDVSHVDKLSKVKFEQYFDPEDKVIHVDMGPQNTILLTEKGSVYTCGANKHGQLGIGGNKSTKKLINKKFNKVDFDLQDDADKVIHASITEQNAGLLTEKGKVLFCGNNSEHFRFTVDTSTKYSFVIADLNLDASDKVTSLHMTQGRFFILTEKGSFIFSTDGLLGRDIMEKRELNLLEDGDEVAKFSLFKNQISITTKKRYSIMIEDTFGCNRREVYKRKIPENVQSLPNCTFVSLNSNEPLFTKGNNEVFIRMNNQSTRLCIGDLEKRSVSLCMSLPPVLKRHIDTHLNESKSDTGVEPYLIGYSNNISRYNINREISRSLYQGFMSSRQGLSAMNVESTQSNNNISQVVNHDEEHRLIQSRRVPD